MPSCPHQAREERLARRCWLYHMHHILGCGAFQRKAAGMILVSPLIIFCISNPSCPFWRQGLPISCCYSPTNSYFVARLVVWMADWANFIVGVKKYIPRFHSVLFTSCVRNELYVFQILSISSKFQPNTCSYYPFSSG